MSLIRTRQPVVTRVLPHDANRRYIRGESSPVPAASGRDQGPYAWPLDWPVFVTVGGPGGRPPFKYAVLSGPPGAIADYVQYGPSLNVIAHSVEAAVYGIQVQVTDALGRVEDVTVFGNGGPPIILPGDPLSALPNWGPVGGGWYGTHFAFPYNEIVTSDGAGYFYRINGRGSYWMGFTGVTSGGYWTEHTAQPDGGPEAVPKLGDKIEVKLVDRQTAAGTVGTKSGLWIGAQDWRPCPNYATGTAQVAPQPFWQGGGA